MVLFEAFLASAAQSDGFPVGAASSCTWRVAVPQFPERCSVPGRLGPPGHPTAGARGAVMLGLGTGAPPRVWCPQSTKGSTVRSGLQVPSPGCSPGVGSAQILFCCKTLGFPQPPKLAPVSAPPSTADMAGSPSPAGEPSRGLMNPALVDPTTAC